MKEKIRTEILDKRTALTPEQIRSKSGRIVDRLIRLEIFENAGTVMLYVSRKSEVATGRLIETAIASGKKVTVPVSREEGRRLLPVVIDNPEEDLSPGTRGIMEPEISPEKYIHPGELDLVVLPGIAFDPAGNRIGWGAAFYDTFLKAVGPKTEKIALAFECQLVDTILPSRHDIPIDRIITEKRVIDCSQTRSRRKIASDADETEE